MTVYKGSCVISFGNRDLLQMGKLIETLEKQLESKGRELVEYRVTHNLKIEGAGQIKVDDKLSEDNKSSGVLVNS